MTKKDIEGFLSNPFFVAIKPKNNEEINVELMLKNSFEYGNRGNDYIIERILERYSSNNGENYRDYRDNYIVVVKQVLLECLILEDALKYFCLDNEYDKIVELIERKQIQAKQVVGVLNRVTYFLDVTNADIASLSLKLGNDIKRQIVKFQNDFVIKLMGPLKTKIDSITSGVSLKCYLDFYQERHSIYTPLSKEIITYVKETHGYDLNQLDDYNKRTSLERVLSISLLNNTSIWNFNYPTKALFYFVALVESYNDIKHATKIIDYAFSEACKNPKIKKLYDNKIPFNLYDFEDEMISFASNRINVNFSNKTDIKLSDDEKKGLIYPIYKGNEKQIEEGKALFLDFLQTQYQNDYNKILDLFNDIENAIQDEESKNDGMVRKRRVTIRQMLDCDVLGFRDIDDKRKYLSVFYNDFEARENTLARFYYRIYIIKKYTANFDSYVYEYLYPMLKMIDSKYHITCKNVTENSLREPKYQLLKDILAKRNINIDDSYKNLYIIALLDRKYATFDEAAMFAELEQYGDAIYELAVDNILFYDPEFKTALDHQEREKYVNAKSQIVVSQKLGLDKAYISKLHDTFNNKYDDYDYEYYETGLSGQNEGNYIADSLEMIIAVIAKEFGIQKALDFTTSIIIEANPDLKQPVIYKNFDYVEFYNNQKYDNEYLDKIYPRFFNNESYYDNEYRTLSDALYKILKIRIIGNDTKEKRRYVADYNSLLPHKNVNCYEEWYQFAVCYLHYGIEETIKKYTDTIKSHYNKIKQ